MAHVIIPERASADCRQCLSDVVDVDIAIRLAAKISEMTNGRNVKCLNPMISVLSWCT